MSSSHNLCSQLSEPSKPRIVLSGVNLVEAGPLAVMQDALDVVAHQFPEYQVHALVHRRELFSTSGVIYHEYPEVKASWLRRVYFEYLKCMTISQQIKPYLWLSMHDMTARVSVPRQATYCHNPAPFNRLGIREALLSYRSTIMVMLYGLLYKLYNQRNDYVVVQQEWVRRGFQERYKPKRVVVAHPSVKHLPRPIQSGRAGKPGEPFRFFYPAYPRTFKKMEVLLKAVRLLGDSNAPEFVLRLTIDGTENRYAQQLRQRYGDLRQVQWLGMLPRASVMEQYAEVDTMLFPSRLETWGMPLTEFKETGKPILVADLPYAHETIGTYSAVRFVPSRDVAAWAEAMRGLCEGRQVVGQATAQPIAQPFVENWRDLFTLLLGEATN